MSNIEVATFLMSAAAYAQASCAVAKEPRWRAIWGWTGVVLVVASPVRLACG